MLASLTGSNDESKWLAYLMNQNGEQASGQDAFSSLLSHLFQNALTILVTLKAMDAADQAAQKKVVAEQKQNDSQAATVVKRERETVDVAAAKSQAEMVYNVEMSNQQQSQGLRQA